MQIQQHFLSIKREFTSFPNTKAVALEALTAQLKEEKYLLTRFQVLVLIRLIKQIFLWMGSIFGRKCRVHNQEDLELRIEQIWQEKQIRPDPEITSCLANSDIIFRNSQIGSPKRSRQLGRLRTLSRNKIRRHDTFSFQMRVI